MRKIKQKAIPLPMPIPETNELSFEDAMRIIIKAPKEVVDQKMKELKQKKKRH